MQQKLTDPRQWDDREEEEDRVEWWGVGGAAVQAGLSSAGKSSTCGCGEGCNQYLIVRDRCVSEQRAVEALRRAYAVLFGRGPCVQDVRILRGTDTGSGGATARHIIEFIATGYDAAKAAMLRWKYQDVFYTCSVRFEPDAPPPGSVPTVTELCAGCAFQDAFSAVFDEQPVNDAKLFHIAITRPEGSDEPLHVVYLGSGGSALSAEEKQRLKKEYKKCFRRTVHVHLQPSPP